MKCFVADREWIYNELQCRLEFNCVLAKPNTFMFFQEKSFEFVVACLFLTVLRHLHELRIAAAVIVVKVKFYGLPTLVLCV